MARKTHEEKRAEKRAARLIKTSQKRERKYISGIIRTSSTGIGTAGPMGPEGPQGPAGAKGSTGAKGDPFEYSDFTTEQLIELTGPTGPRGPEGSPATITKELIEEVLTGEIFTHSHASSGGLNQAQIRRLC